MAKTAAALLRSTGLWKPPSLLHQTREEPKFPPLHFCRLNSLFPKGLSRGIIAEISGPRSSGKTSTCFHILAEATARGETCAIIDIDDSFHPASAAAAGIKLEQLIWVRCQGNAEYAIRATDLILHAGGFGVVLLDLCEASLRVLNRIPLSYWYRFRRAVEHTPTILLICAGFPQARSCSSKRLELRSKAFRWSGKAPFLLLRGLEANAMFRQASLLGTTSLLFDH
jgi:hypothetical protein